MTDEQFKSEAREELVADILPFWAERMLDPEGGFYGRMDGLGKLDKGAPRGLILNARILWTFASAYRILKNEEYLKTAEHAKDYILEHFLDKEYGGAFWSLNADGTPLDTKKQFYAIAFTIYALAEFNRATGDNKALETAIDLFHSIEDHSFDEEFDGYIEACARDWRPIADMRLSEKDQNDAKTMNTHLHIIEGYTCLYRVWKDELLEKRLRGLIIIFLNRITGPDGHLQLFFDERWNLNGRIQSFGHDIECSWLLWEAACVLGDEALKSRSKAVCARLADAGMEGYTPDEGMIYEWDIAAGEKNLGRDWWVQAEAVAGCLYRWKLTSDAKWRDAAENIWQYIKSDIIAPDGEWYWGRGADGGVNTEDDRAGFWKCPYHNGRMCMEIIENLL